MTFPRENVEKVKEEFEALRLENEEKRKEKLREVYSRSARVKEIDEMLQRTGFEIFGAAMSKKDGVNLEERIAEIKEKNEALQKERESILISLGYDKNYTDYTYRCSVCQDEGYVNGKMCSCYKDALIKKGYEASGLARLIEKQSFETFDLNYYTGKAREYAEKNWLDLNLYAKEFDKNKSSFLFMGATGLGKTHLSTAVAKVLIEKGYYVVYETAQNIFTDFDADRFRDRYSDTELKSKKYLECDLLIIDDLGTEVPSSVNVAYLYNIINTRLNASLPIIASTNLTSDEIRKMYQDRITSRLFGEFQIRLFLGNDIRKLKMGM